MTDPEGFSHVAYQLDASELVRMGSPFSITSDAARAFAQKLDRMIWENVMALPKGHVFAVSPATFDDPDLDPGTMRVTYRTATLAPGQPIPAGWTAYAETVSDD